MEAPPQAGVVPRVSERKTQMIEFSMPERCNNGESYHRARTLILLVNEVARIVPPTHWLRIIGASLESQRCQQSTYLSKLVENANYFRDKMTAAS